jgi:hypothetical protein
LIGISEVKHMPDDHEGAVEEIKKIYAEEIVKKDDRGIYLFISFDMVNSTALKIKKMEEWPSVVTYFYETIAKEMKDNIDSSRIWKYLGDEIVFYYIISNASYLYDIPECVYKIQEKVVLKIREDFKIDKIIDIKCTMWLAGVRYLKPGPIDNQEKTRVGINNDIYRNINISIDSQGRDIEDFLGPDIDIGFRIAKYATKSKVALSAEYAYLLYCLGKPKKIKKIDKKLKIVSFQELKGVWDGRAYPIIWYCPNWENTDNIFDYDEHINNEIIKEIEKRKDIEYLEKVFEETEKIKYVEEFVEICRKYNKREKKMVGRLIT